MVSIPGECVDWKNMRYCSDCSGLHQDTVTESVCHFIGHFNPCAKRGMDMNELFSCYCSMTKLLPAVTKIGPRLFSTVLVFTECMSCERLAWKSTGKTVRLEGKKLGFAVQGRSH